MYSLIKPIIVSRVKDKLTTVMRDYILDVVSRLNGYLAGLGNRIESAGAQDAKSKALAIVDELAELRRRTNAKHAKRTKKDGATLNFVLDKRAKKLSWGHPDGLIEQGEMIECVDDLQCS